jgi:DNA-binding phage protein
MRNDPFCAEVAAKFKEAIAARRISKAQAARDLGISRQMLYEYLSATSMPRHQVLERACTSWNLQLNYKDFLVTAQSFKKPSQPISGRVPVQLDLLAAVRALRDQDLDVHILRKDATRVELCIELRLGAA